MAQATMNDLAAWIELHKSIRKLGSFSDNWPSHGNAPLAIAASYALLQKRAVEAEAARDRAAIPTDAEQEFRAALQVIANWPYVDTPQAMREHARDALRRHP